MSAVSISATTLSLTTTTIPSQAQTSSSPVPNNNHNGGGLFSSAASPALILAFLAIGIFAGGLLCVSLMRRLGISNVGRERREMIARREAAVRGWAVNVAAADSENSGAILTAAVAPTTARSVRKQTTVGVRPKLWDLDSHPLSAINHGACPWNTMKPLALSYTRTLSSQDELAHFGLLIPVDRPPPKRHAFVRWLNAIVPLSSPAPAAPPHPPAQLHLAIAVAMPTPHRLPSRDPTVPVYELGLTKVSWNSEALDALTESAVDIRTDR